jgi:DtxR family transcriptional regulator, Mn-dependent transcriptional regulator
LDVSKPDLSAAIQDYVKEIYKLQSSGTRATTTAIAKAMGVAPSSATSMLKKLAVLGLAEHAPYRGVELSEQGQKIALEVIRHHRLLEQYLAETLGLPIDAVHDEADRLEHVISEELEARIDESLGYPTHDPHGDPIPDAGLNVDRTTLRSLEALVPGEEATVQRIPDGDAALVRYLAELTLVPGRKVTMRRSEPFGGPLTVDVDGSEHAISRELAGQIGVSG